MNELLEKGQEISIVPQDFRNSNKAKVIDVHDNSFELEVFRAPTGIVPKYLSEFYSPTKNGMLYFVTDVTSIDGNKLTVSMPRKHRFLQRRAFTRIKMKQNLELSLGDKSFKVLLLDLSAGGIKLETSERIDIDSEYDLKIGILGAQVITCKLDPIRVIKNDNATYTVSGRFKNLSNVDKMALVQFCMRKNIENENK